MKKSLFALAAVTAFAGAAQAQSSVTVYGILDVGFTGADSTSPTLPSANPAPLNQKQIKRTSAQFGQSAETTSRLGFKGQEDLGGGLSGLFTAEFQLYPQSGTLSSDAPGSTTGTGLVNRQTFVGLKKNGLGQVAIGTQYTPIFQSVAASDPGQTNNVVGSIIYPAKANGQDTSVPSFTVRQNNSLTVNTDRFAGFSAKAMYVQNNADSTQLGYDNQYTSASSAGGTTNTNGWGLGADFTWQKLYVVAAYQSLKNQTNTTAVTPITANTATNNGVNTQSNEAYAAATYDFGILKAYVNWVSRSVTSVLNSSQYAKRSGQQLGVRSMITPTVEAWGSIGNGRYQAYGAGEPTANINAWQLGSNYYLSKRTNLYAIYGKAQTSNVISTGTAGVYGNASASQYAVGVRHTF